MHYKYQVSTTSDSGGSHPLAQRLKLLVRVLTVDCASLPGCAATRALAHLIHSVFQGLPRHTCEGIDTSDESQLLSRMCAQTGG